MKKLIILLLITTSLHLNGQNFHYKFSFEIDSILANDSTPYKYQTAAAEFSFIGEYNNSLVAFDKIYTKAKHRDTTQEQKDILSKYHPVNAEEYIIQNAAKTRVIIINEKHHVPLHRVFAASLLKKLKTLGYTFIGFETLNYDDTLLNERKYPLLKSGYYSKEPCFGNFIRLASKLNYTIFPYEQNYKDTSQRYFDRELNEAFNIKRMLDKNPTAKFVIYCGYDHAIEDSTYNYFVLPMAGQLKRLTGIDPFTIDQVEFAEYNLVGNSYRKAMSAKSDVVYLDSAGNMWNKLMKKHYSIDCFVFHPNTYYINGRPGWQLTPDKIFIDIKSKITIHFPCLVKVYEPNDNINEAVPIDIIELQNKADNKEIIVNRSAKNYVVMIENKEGQHQEFTLK